MCPATSREAIALRSKLVGVRGGPIDWDFYAEKHLKIDSDKEARLVKYGSEMGGWGCERWDDVPAMSQTMPIAMLNDPRNAWYKKAFDAMRADPDISAVVPPNRKSNQSFRLPGLMAFQTCGWPEGAEELAAAKAKAVAEVCKASLTGAKIQVGLWPEPVPPNPTFASGKPMCSKP